jgi:hypothetical protein
MYFDSLPLVLVHRHGFVIDGFGLADAADNTLSTQLYTQDVLLHRYD